MAGCRGAPTCDRFLSPSTVPADGTCPDCGRPVDPGRAHAPTSTPRARRTQRTAGTFDCSTAAADRSDASAEDDDETSPLPWHLWLLLAALTVYLGYRAFQGLEWVFGL